MATFLYAVRFYGYGLTVTFKKKLHKSDNYFTLFIGPVKIYAQIYLQAPAE